MAPELVLVGLALSWCGPILMLGGLLPLPIARHAAGRSEERSAWRRLWLPLLPAAIVLALLAGWSLQEPDPADEAMVPMLLLLDLPFALIWARAVWRASLGLWRRPKRITICTIGLFRPRILSDPHFLDALDPEARNAAFAHELEHVRHRDPLRIWLAQLATDLQWPAPRARRRLRSWLDALELARDEGAREAGVAGEDLAAAILAAASRGSHEGCIAAGITGTAPSLKDRIERLLAPLFRAEPDRRNHFLAATLLLIAALAVGVFHGEALVQALPGIMVR